MIDDQLAELDRRVADRIAAAWKPLWPLPDDPLPEIAWSEPAEPLPDDWPQFPRERWCILPHTRMAALLLAEKLLEQNKVTEAAWLYVFGGKMRIS